MYNTELKIVTPHLEKNPFQILYYPLPRNLYSLGILSAVKLLQNVNQSDTVRLGLAERK